MTDETPATVDAKPPVDKRRAGLGCLGLVALCGMVSLLWPKSDRKADSELLTRAMIGDAWPLTVDVGTVRCEGVGSVVAVTFIAGGKTYAVNGTARSDKSLSDIHDIWSPGMDLAPVLDRGLALCK